MIAFLNLLDTEEEKEKFTDLYNLYKDLLYWIAFNKIHNPEDAEECVQETFFYIAKHFDKIDEIDCKRTKSYLSTIVSGFAIDIYNNSIQSNVYSSDDVNDYNDDIAYFENYNEIELKMAIDKYLDQESKIFLYLKYVYAYKSKEIADLYNVKDSYVRKKLQYAKDKLRNKLSEKD